MGFPLGPKKEREDSETETIGEMLPADLGALSPQTRGVPSNLVVALLELNAFRSGYQRE